MKDHVEEHQGHHIEIRTRRGKTEVAVDGVTMKHERLLDGRYFFSRYAYDPAGDLRELARRYIDYKQRAHQGHKRHDEDV